MPETSSLAGAPSHFVNLVKSAYMRCLKLPVERREQWLELGFDMDFSSDSLLAVGITRRNFAIPSESCCGNTPIVNRLVVDLEQFRVSQNLMKKTVVEWLHKLGSFELKLIPWAIDCVMKQYDEFQKNKHRSPEDLVVFINGHFKCGANESDSRTHVGNSGPKICPSAETDHTVCIEKLRAQKEEIKTLKRALSDLSNEKFELLASESKLKQSISDLEMKRVKLMEKCLLEKSLYNDAAKKERLLKCRLKNAKKKQFPIFHKKVKVATQKLLR